MQQRYDKFLGKCSVANIKDDEMYEMLKAVGVLALVAAIINPARSWATQSAVGAPTVVDSVGLVVGEYLTMPATPPGSYSHVPVGTELVRVTSGTYRFTVEASLSSGFNENNTIYFRFSDCAGPAYIIKTGASKTLLGELSIVVGNTIYVPETTLQNHHFLSYISARDGITSECNDISGTPPFWAAYQVTKSIPVASLGFTPPFSVQ